MPPYSALYSRLYSVGVRCNRIHLVKLIEVVVLVELLGDVDLVPSSNQRLVTRSAEKQTL